MTTRTYTPRASEIERQWFVVDADGETLGRLASRIATLLAGKHKPTYATHMDTGDHVIVVNAGKIDRDRRQAARPSPTPATAAIPGGFREETLGDLLARRPEEVIRRAVKGMLPHNKLGVQQLRKLKVYAGPEHPHEAQQPAALPTTGVPTRMSTTPAYYQGTGRRKTSVARVRLIAGEGEVVVNGRSLEEHFGNAVSLSDILMPFRVTDTEGRFNAMVKVEGGGSQGQAGAIRHGIARALLESDPEARPCAAAPGRLPDPRPAHEGTQEVRPEARPQGAAVHQALMRSGRARSTTRRRSRSARRTRRGADHPCGAPCAVRVLCARARVGTCRIRSSSATRRPSSRATWPCSRASTRRRWRATRRPPRWPAIGRCRS